MKKIVVGIAVMLTCLFQASSLWAQTSSQIEEGETIYSMGVPSRYEFSLGPMFVIDRQGDETKYGGQIFANLHRHIHSPLFGLGIAGEGYVQYLDADDEDVDGGVRLMAALRPLGLQLGADYTFQEEQVDFILSFAYPFRRSGIFGHGTSLRFDWIPGRDHSFNLGVTIPIGERHFGKARPKSTRVRLPKASGKSPVPKGVELPEELQQSLETLAHAVEWINRYSTPFFDQAKVGDAQTKNTFLHALNPLKEHLRLKDELYHKGHSFPAEIEMYHRMLNLAFAQAIAADTANVTAAELDEGIRISTQAKKILFKKVLLPYDRLLGQSKRHDSLRGYASQALEELRGWIDNVSQFSDSQQTRVLAVFERVLDEIEEQRKFTAKLWKDSELVWLPLQYALHPDDYDEREEMNALVEEIAGQSFSNANEIYYVINEQFQQEVAQMILQAEDYHVLWIHDYRGVNAAGEPDSVSYRQTQNYLEALTERVRDYDRVGKLPLYLMFIDQYFFELNDRRWIEFLENPLHNKMRLPPEYAEWSKTPLGKAQEKLRQAVAESTLLQERAQKYGRKWLEKTVKVHVNITNPADHSYRNSQLARFIPIVPDNLARDHRKISFYDATELDPGKGEALYSGMGIGEQYVGATWDDRAMLARGPVLLSLKNEARRLLKQQGFTDEQIPPPLRSLPLPENYDEMLEGLRQKGWRALAMDVHNQTGFQSKDLTVLKSALYTIMPAGSSILLPDGYWNAQVWGSMLTGAALRGCKVFLVAPAPENSTFSTATMLLSRTQVLFSRLVMVQNALEEAIHAVGGALKTGIYARESALGTTEAVDELLANFENTPFLKEWLPFPEAVYTTIEKSLKAMIYAGYQPTYYSEDAEDRKTKLHYKVSLFVSEPVHKLMQVPGWDKIIRGYLAYRLKFLAREEGEFVDMKESPEELRVAFTDTVIDFVNALSEEERRQAMAYLIVGSQNHNYRSIITDGEMGCLVSGISALTPLLDMFFMSGMTTWVNDLDELGRLLPEQSGFLRWVGRYIRKVM
ncbi:MAG: hypothetical protein GY801_43000 [bacterium]|nr:hypothetical protein [bacterium]